MGEYEPDDSRNVTGAGSGERQQQQQGQAPQQGIRSPGGADQQMGGDRWRGDDAGSHGHSQRPESAQQQQFDQTSGQMGGFGADLNEGATLRNRIRDHMEVIGADGVHIGTVDGVEGNRIKLTKKDADAGFEGGTHSGHHHYLSCGLVAGVEGNRVRLSANADTAWGMIEEE